MLRNKLRSIYKRLSRKIILDLYKIPSPLLEEAQAELDSKVRSYIESVRHKAFLVYKSREIVFQGNSEAALRERLLAFPGKEEVVVMADTTVISPGTELAQLNRLPNAAVSFPLVPGYSGSGIVLKAGSKTGFKRNQKICGLIPHASISKVNYADIFPVPDNVDAQDSACVTFALIALRGLQRVNIDKNKCVVIIGQGTIGQILLQIVKSMGPRECIVVTRSKSKQSVSYQNGADQCIATSDNCEEIKRIKADIIFDVTPDPNTVNLAIAMAAINARIVLLGSSRGLCTDFPLQELTKKNIILEGAHARLALLSREERKNLVGQFYDLLVKKDIRVESLLAQTLCPEELCSFYFRLAKGQYDQTGNSIDWSSLNDTNRKSIVFSDLKPHVLGVSKDFPINVLAGKCDLEYKKKPDSDTRLGYALIGCGEIGLSNARAIATSCNSRLTYVVDTYTRLAKEIADQYGCQFSTDFHEALNDDSVEAAYISTPHHLHIPIASTCVHRGIHSIVEKPLSNDLESAQCFYDEINGSKTKSTIAFLLRYDPKIQFFKKFISDGNIGDIEGVEFSLKVNKPPSYWRTGNIGRTHSDWRSSKEKAGGGIIVMQLCHHFDRIRFITGLEVEDVSCVPYFEDGMDVESAANISFRLSNNAIGVMQCTYLSKGYEENKLIIIGSEGQVDLYNSCFYSVNAVNGLRGRKWYEVTDFPSVKLRQKMIQDFSDSILNNTQSTVQLLDGLKAQEIIDKCYRSCV